MKAGRYITESNYLRRDYKDKINRELDNLVKNTYFPDIPLDEITDILEDYGLILLQEDYTEFDGFLAGEDGRVMLELGFIDSLDDRRRYTPVENSLLVINWYKSERRNFEVNVYLS